MGDNLYVVIGLLKSGKQQPRKSGRQGEKNVLPNHINHTGKYLGYANVGKQSEAQSTYLPLNSTDG